jgi:hypothetical protein
MPMDYHPHGELHSVMSPCNGSEVMNGGFGSHDAYDDGNPASNECTGKGTLSQERKLGIFDNEDYSLSPSLPRFVNGNSSFLGTTRFEHTSARHVEVSQSYMLHSTTDSGPGSMKHSPKSDPDDDSATPFRNLARARQW